MRNLHTPPGRGGGCCKWWIVCVFEGGYQTRCARRAYTGVLRGPFQLI